MKAAQVPWRTSVRLRKLSTPAAAVRSRYYLGTANAGGADTFRLCWAAAPIVMLNYNVEIGPFMFDVPDAGSGSFDL